MHTSQFKLRGKEEHCPQRPAAPLALPSVCDTPDSRSKHPLHRKHHPFSHIANRCSLQVSALGIRIRIPVEEENIIAASLRAHSTFGHYNNRPSTHRAPSAVASTLSFRTRDTLYVSSHSHHPASDTPLNTCREPHYPTSQAIWSESAFVPINGQATRQSVTC